MNLSYKSGINILIMLLMFLGAAGKTAGTSNNNSYCLEELKKTIKVQQDAAQHALLQGKVWHMKYTLIAKALNPYTKKNQDITSHGELKASKKMRVVKTDNAEVYMDEYDIFTVYKTDKVVMRTKPLKGSLAIKDEPFEALMQDSLFKKYQLISCNNTVMKAGDSAIVKYVLAPRNARTEPYTNITFYVAPLTYIVKRVDITFNHAMSASVHSYSIFITDRDELNAEPELEHVSMHFLNKKGQLKPPYSSYEYKEYK